MQISERDFKIANESGCTPAWVHTRFKVHLWIVIICIYIHMYVCMLIVEVHFMIRNYFISEYKLIIILTGGIPAMPFQ